MKPVDEVRSNILSEIKEVCASKRAGEINDRSASNDMSGTRKEDASK